MRPLKLTMKGFCCFRDPVEIAFENMDVFVISGPTGAGKSTIIDGICYALYGKVPRGTDAGALIAHGCNQMAVELEFQAGEEHYRVHRGINVIRRTRRDGTEQVSRSVSPAQLEHFDGVDWQPLEGRVKQIDGEIERTVGLDFAGFTRCVLLPQGQFQEFLIGAPAGRNKIIESLLDLEIYGRMMQSANTTARDLSKEVESYQRRLKEDFADATQEALDVCMAQLGRAKEQHALAAAEQGALAGALTEADAMAQALKRREADEAERARRAADLQTIEDLLSEGQARLEEFDGEIEAARAQLNAVPYDQGLHQKLMLAQERALQVKARKLEAVNAKERAEDTRTLEAAARGAEELAVKYGEAREQVRRLEEQREAAVRLHAAAHLQTGLSAGDPCPVCGAVIAELPQLKTAPDLQRMEQQLAAARALEQRTGKDSSAAAVALARAESDHQAAVEAAEKSAAALGAALQALRDVLPAGIPLTAAAIEGALQEQREYLQQREALSARLTELRDKRAALQAQLAGAEARRKGLQELLATLDARIAEAQEAAEKHRAALQHVAGERGWDDAAAALASGRDPAPLLKTRYEAASSDVTGLVGSMAALQSQEERIRRDMERAEILRGQMQETDRRAGLYHQLGLLLRVDGFRRFVREEAMHILAAAGSEHLQTMYPRFALTVDGDQFLVIDHWQADEVRPAGTLSGGETFVASLSLALALAEQLPALRSAAAATLESLFLDEGFGTLDPETLDTVIGALEGLRAQERLVGIITHVPELAKRIECRIEVSKSPEGSHIALTGA